MDVRSRPGADTFTVEIDAAQSALGAHVSTVSVSAATPTICANVGSANVGSLLDEGAPPHSTTSPLGFVTWMRTPSWVCVQTGAAPDSIVVPPSLEPPTSA